MIINAIAETITRERKRLLNTRQREDYLITINIINLILTSYDSIVSRSEISRIVESNARVILHKRDKLSE